MTHRYTHRVFHSRAVPYSFQCEHCRNESGPLTATIRGNEAEYKSPHKTLPRHQEEFLQQLAHCYLVNEVYREYSNATEKQIFSQAFHDTCPHCQQPQSWAVAGLQADLWSGPVAAVIVAVIVAIGSYFFAIESILLSACFAAVGVLAALMLFLWKYGKLIIQRRKTANTLQNHLPQIDWSAVQDLIDEKLAQKKQ